MATRYTNKVLLLIIVVLLITNIIMVVFFVFTPEKQKRQSNTPESGLAEMLQDSVHFSETQMNAYTELRSIERPKLKEYFGRMRKNKEKFYDLVTAQNADSLSNELADSIAILQRQIDLHMRDYFLAIRQICTEDQLPAYDRVIAKVVSRITSRPRSRSDDSPRQTRDSAGVR